MGDRPRPWFLRPRGRDGLCNFNQSARRLKLPESGKTSRPPESIGRRGSRATSLTYGLESRERPALPRQAGSGLTGCSRFAQMIPTGLPHPISLPTSRDIDPVWAKRSRAEPAYVCVGQSAPLCPVRAHKPRLGPTRLRCSGSPNWGKYGSAAGE